MSPTIALTLCKPCIPPPPNQRTHTRAHTHTTMITAEYLIGIWFRSRRDGFFGPFILSHLHWPNTHLWARWPTHRGGQRPWHSDKPVDRFRVHPWTLVLSQLATDFRGHIAAWENARVLLHRRAAGSHTFYLLEPEWNALSELCLPPCTSLVRQTGPWENIRTSLSPLTLHGTDSPLPLLHYEYSAASPVLLRRLSLGFSLFFSSNLLMEVAN